MLQSIHPSQDGSDTVFSEKYNAHYHSIFGAIEEAIHVFISAGLYHYQRKGYEKLNIFEMGFGTGLNAFLTFLESQRFNLKINYATIESDPVNAEISNSLNYSNILNSEFDHIFKKLHDLDWNSNHLISDTFSFIKYHDAIENHLFDRPIDLIFYDAFAPSCQDYLWEEDIHQKLYNQLNKGGALVTYCTKGTFKRMLQKMGYKIEKLNGPAKKREMMRAIKI